MNALVDFLLFRKMASPFLLQILFWAGIGGTFYGAYVLLQLDNWAWCPALVFGSLGTRVLFERLLLSFRSFEQLEELVDLLRRNTGEQFLGK